MKGFFHRACPLCQQDVALDRPNSFCVLPLQPGYARLFSHEDCVSERRGEVTVLPDLRLGQLETYPTLAYRQRAFFIHWRCYRLAGEPTYPQLYCLIDAVEPTVMGRGTPPASIHGAFSPPTACVGSEARSPGGSGSPSPDSLTGMTRKHGAQSLGRFLQAFPCEIWAKVLEYDVGRMLYVMEAASQMSTLDCVSMLEGVPEHRFSSKIVAMDTSTVRIHLVDVGGRIYVSNLSDALSGRWTLKQAVTDILLMCMAPAATLMGWIFSAYAWEIIFNLSGFRATPKRTDRERETSRDCNLGGSTYFAAKCDGMGVMDVAFHERADGTPKWILGNSAHPFPGEISVIRCADVRRIRLVRDVCSPLVSGHLPAPDNLPLELPNTK